MSSMKGGGKGSERAGQERREKPVGTTEKCRVGREAGRIRMQEEESFDAGCCPCCQFAGLALQ
jgi:hypothetical protein